MGYLFVLSALLQTGIEDPNQFADFLILGYALMWGVGFFYILSLWNRQRNIRKDLELMTQLLEEDEEAPTT